MNTSGSPRLLRASATALRALVAAVLRGAALAATAPVVLLHGLLNVVLLGPLLGAALLFRTPAPVDAARRAMNGWRRLVGAWSGREIPVPYREPPARPVPDADGFYVVDDHLYATERVAWVMVRLGAWAEDPAARRDLAWLLTYPVVALAGLVPAALIALGVGGAWFGAPVWTLLGVPLGLALARPLAGVPGRWTRWKLGEIPARTLSRRTARRRWVDGEGLVLVRLVALAGLGLLALPLLVISLVGVVLGVGLGLVFLAPAALTHFRWLADLRRQLATDWSGVPVASPYRPVPEPELRPDGRYRVDRQLYRSGRMARANARSGTVLKDPSSWRDLLWLLLDPVAGVAVALLPVALAAYGFWALTLSGALALLGGPHDDWYAAVAGNVPAAVPAGVVLTVAGLWLAPHALRWHGRWTALLLRPTRAAVLAGRVERLTRARDDVADDQAREVRRIERDLHDGAQARLVALGLTLGTVERLLDTDPDTARRLVGQAKDVSGTALAELRQLVRGIRPPVLAERGLGDAVRALALDCPVPVEVTVELPGRPGEAVESAAYFAVSEALTNAVRHSGARLVTVDISDRTGALRLVVRDDGRGGADPAGGGLAGVRRRLAAFDGTLEVASPRGGPTVVTMEVPCVSFSPRISTSSGTA